MFLLRRVKATEGTITHKISRPIIEISLKKFWKEFYPNKALG